MATITRCDRCREDILHPDTPTKTTVTTNGPTFSSNEKLLALGTIDLCRPCASALFTFLTTQPPLPMMHRSV